MQVDREKEQTRTVGVGMAEQPPAVDLAQNVFYGHSGTNHVGRVDHKDASEVFGGPTGRTGTSNARAPIARASWHLDVDSVHPGD